MSDLKNGQANQAVLINSVNRTLDIIEYLYKQNKGTSISQISKDLNLYKSTVYRTLATLQNRRYVEQDSSNETYFLGSKIYALAGGNASNQAMAEIIKPYMYKLNDKYKDAVNLGVLERDKNDMYNIRILEECASKSALGAKVDIGSMNECYCASLGKCLLAFSEDIDLNVYNNATMEKFTESTITNVDGLRDELEKIRKQGYACDDEEREIGLFCVGVPIYRNGRAVAAISLSGPKFRVMDDNFQEKVDYMKELSAEITSNLFIK